MELVNVFDYESLAQTSLDAGTWAYFAGGADDEITLRANRRAFEQVQLRPRVLVDVSCITMNTRVLGIPVEMPILVAPIGFQGLAHPDGECATASASTKTIMIVSTFSSRTLEEIAQVATGPLWFQLTAPNRLWTERLVQRAAAAGYRALVITVDAPRSGRKEAAQRLDFHLPAYKANFGDEPMGNGFTSLPTWSSLAWLRSLTSLPIVLKGILTAEDALLALDHGMDGIIVSNHGGRQLDGVPATLEVLPEIIEAVNGRCEIYMDSGIRRGTDVLKALALGAQAVLVGRPIIWGLAVNGADGVANVLDMVRTEFEQAMALVGCSTLTTINPSFVRRMVFNGYLNGYHRS
ncbi:alpha-hydroxy acid oxidase [Dictyobacter kobayashii]|uniref:Alpha-hydroxy-acid oxidizing enzyme n=1 Tax=Dictyobacter kobayashii TaxID=2014872 RepID=A0A402ASY7_9CHLR|nr:alpha-hydroxy acid oxidase [Dictyobacter kobayashii]GCE22238.1 alpha-hydroxy-acid oxidizing enzyme [Dictyobacter kobayashii]